MIRKNFIRKTENFRCKNCDLLVEGSGYTNHCPKCLWSRHVDLEVPGDRKSDCRGLMEPVGFDKKRDEYIILHRCQKCGKKTKNKASKEDNFEEVLKLS